MRPAVPNGAYSHGVLVHRGDEELVASTTAFVERGLASGGQVLVHGTTDRVDLLHDALGSRPRLEYGFDADLYQAPTTTLFAYQRRLAESPEGIEFWVTGTVPLGRDAAEGAAWARYESAVNEALSAYPFRALCTYDEQTLPASVIAAARATHPTVSTDLISTASPEYVDPAAFLQTALAHVPELPRTPPSVTTSLNSLDQLAQSRYMLLATARASSALPQQSIDGFLTAVNEVATNGLVHGSSPVQIAFWADVTTLVCRVADSGTAALDPLAGYRFPEGWGGAGLWTARQLVDDLFISNPPEGGRVVVLAAGCR